MGEGGHLDTAPTLKIPNFQTFRAMTTKFGDFSENLSGNISTSAFLVHSNHILTGMFY